jgi:hypothetical protein
MEFVQASLFAATNTPAGAVERVCPVKFSCWLRRILYDR